MSGLFAATAADGIILATVGGAEADAYWCLCKLLDGIQDHYTHAQPGIQRTVFRLTELVRRGGGSIVNVASIAARLGARYVGQVPHGSAKGGVLAMTKHLCAAGGAHGIRANAILPGLIYTPETARFIDDPDGPLPGILAKIPLGRYGQAEEVAKLAAFLASDDASFITGAEIAIDGGDGAVAA